MSPNPPGTPAALEIARVLPAPPATVFAYWTDPKQIQHWLGGPEVKVPEVDVDLRVGGHYRFKLINPDGSKSTIHGAFERVEPPWRLEYSWWIENDQGRTPETVVRVEFRPHEDGTEVRLSHTGFADSSLREQHLAGWESCFVALHRLLA